MPEGFGDLPLTELDLGYCEKLDEVATLQLIIEKFSGLTKLSLEGWKQITDLTEGGLFFVYSIFFSLSSFRVYMSNLIVFWNYKHKEVSQMSDIIISMCSLNKLNVFLHPTCHLHYIACFYSAHLIYRSELPIIKINLHYNG